jgi:hypothetical protein
MDIFVTLRDPAEVSTSRSSVIGAFSTEELARAACQDEENDNAEISGKPAVQLAWKDTSAQAPDGGTYDVILVDLDSRT